MLKIRFDFKALLFFGILTGWLSIVFYVLTTVYEPLIYVAIAFSIGAFLFLVPILIMCVISILKEIPKMFAKIVYRE